MLIDTRQIVTKTQLRENMTELLMLVKKGEELVISDRGEFISLLLPFDFLGRKKKVTKKRDKKFDVIVATKALREELSSQNPNFDSLKALREVREEN